ncbi:hypothetical protein AJ80_03279 [Polytolypa hystricis UAMH7299]|uniref:xyloglucan-specific endo-beta-1,4-glucanase n=1 Tax=Polytolypa hystricis (strain UAMH7299) TaxID=1447883 RepID=A0A2B7YKJ3_POLH7|nr:hypothetical protein AJ80_03279 [Polytolypa hystricis UAMH7299]
MTSASSQRCTGVDSIAGSTLAWHTTWPRTGRSNQVISNTVLLTDPRRIFDISKLPTTWRWKYDGNSLIANAAYDLFTSSSATGDEEYGIIIWLAALGGAGPISSTGSPGGANWKLYEGTNAQMHIYSFVWPHSILYRFN